MKTFDEMIINFKKLGIVLKKNIDKTKDFSFIGKEKEGVQMYESLIIEGKADEVQRECYDCRHLKGALSWWCTNEGAISARGTSKPSVCKCPYWEAAKHINELSAAERNHRNQYIEIRR